MKNSSLGSFRTGVCCCGAELDKMLPPLSGPPPPELLLSSFFLASSFSFPMTRLSAQLFGRLFAGAISFCCVGDVIVELWVSLSLGGRI